VKPQLLSSIKKEFEKLPAVTLSIPKKQLRSLELSPAISDPDNASDLLPRTDIKPRISSKLMKSLDDSNWKNRLAAVNEIEQIIIEANKRIQPTISDLVSALKKRLDDPNVKTLTSTLSLLSLIAVATGPAVEKYCKIILSNIIAKLSHNNKTVRVLGLSTLETWVEIMTLEPMIKFFPKGLYTEKGHPDGRKDCLSFILKYLPSVKQKDATTFEPIIKTIIDSIQDPKPEVRKIAEKILSEIVSYTGVEEIKKNCRDLKPAFRQTVNSILDKYSGVLSTHQSDASRNTSAMEMDDKDEIKTESQPSSSTHIQRHQATTIKKSATEVQFHTSAASSIAPESQTPRMPERAVAPPLIISELDKSQPIPISKLIASIQIDRTNNENSINALKKLVEILNNDRRAVVPHVKELVECLTNSVQQAFEMVGNGHANIRICKYLLNTKMLLFSKRNIVELIDKETLRSLIHQLLTRLLDEKLPLLEDGQNLLRAFNQLMINILQNSNRTATYTALLNLLASSHDNLSMKKYTELVVKCLLKLTKALQSTIDRIQIDILLMDLHQFLTSNPPTQFKNKDDLPLRTVKTILNELVKVKGPSIRTHLSFIPTHKNPLIVSYIELMLTNAQKQKEKEGGTDASNSSHSNLPVSKNTDEMNDILNDIFNSIGNKDTCNAGLFRLHKFKKTYPNADINDHLSRCSEVFQVYIKRQLVKIEEHEARLNQGTEQITISSQQVNESQQPSSSKQQQEAVHIPEISLFNRTHTLSSMDAIRAEVKKRQQEMLQQGDATRNASLNRSLSVQDIRRRFREVKVNNNAVTSDTEVTQISSNGSTVQTQPSSIVVSTTPVPAVSISSEQLEALKSRIRAKAKQQTEEQRKQSAEQVIDVAALRAQLQSKLPSTEEEKENQPVKAAGLSNLKERFARLS
jgi:hypothetical protein